MAREKSKLVRVERTTDSGTPYLEKVRQPSKNKAVEPDSDGDASGAPVTSQSAGRQARTK